MQIRLARYRDKSDVDCTTFQDPFRESEDNPNGIVNISTGGKWCYHAWVENEPFEESDRLEDGWAGTTGISRFRDEAHDVELAQELIEVPAVIEKLAETLYMFDIDDTGTPKGVIAEFLLDLKLMLLETWALGLGDTEAIVFLKDEDTPTPLFPKKPVESGT